MEISTISLEYELNRGAKGIELTRTREILYELPPSGRALMQALIFDPHGRIVSELYGVRHHNDFIGKVASELAYLSLQSKLSNGQALLSPGETEQIYDHPFLKSRRTELGRGTIPDGVIFEVQGNVTFLSAVCEYKGISGKDLKKIKREQIRGYNERRAVRELFLDQPNEWQEGLGRAVHKRFPFLPPRLSYNEEDFKTLWVLPGGIALPSQALHAEVVNLPLQHYHLRKIALALREDIWR